MIISQPANTLGVWRHFILLGIFLVAAVFCILNYNLVGAESWDKVEGFTQDSETLVISSLLRSREEALVSDGFGMGRYENPDRVASQYKMWFSDIPTGGSYVSYLSSFGFQRIFFSIIGAVYLASDGWLAGSPAKLEFLKSVNVLLTSIVYSTFLLITLRQIGITAFLASAFVFLASSMPLVFSRNLYWMFFLDLAPFVLAFAVGCGVIREKFGLVAIFVTIFLKCLSGYEFVSSIMLAAVFAFVFGANLVAMPFFSILSQVFKLSAAAFGAFLTAFSLHCMQLLVVLGGADRAWSALYKTVAKRTHGNEDFGLEVIAKSLSADWWEVIQIYWAMPVFSPSGSFARLSSWSVWEASLVLICLSLAGITASWSKAGWSKGVVQSLNLLIIAALSASAPISWYLLAKGHSYIHVHTNGILWWIPFLPLLSLATAHSLAQAFQIWSLNRVIRSLAAGAALSAFIHINLDFTEPDKCDDCFDASASFETMPSAQLLPSGTVLVFDQSCSWAGGRQWYAHIYPRRVADLPDSRKVYAFDNLDVEMKRSRKRKLEVLSPGPMWWSYCVYDLQLPAYPIDRLVLGKLSAGTLVWQATLRPEPLSRIVTRALDFNDDNWKAGVHVSQPLVLLHNEFKASQSLESGMCATVEGMTEVEIASLRRTPKFLNLEMNTSQSALKKYFSFPANVTFTKCKGAAG